MTKASTHPQAEAAGRKAGVLVYLAACVFASASPVLAGSDEAAPVRFEGWPTHYQGRALARVPDPPEEREFYAGTAIQHARFSDGERVVLLRWAAADTRGFHLAERCFTAYGYTVRAGRNREARHGSEHCFSAARGDARVEVCEHIRDAHGHVYADMAAFRLAQLLRRTAPPYWAISVVTPRAASLPTDSPAPP